MFHAQKRSSAPSPSFRRRTDVQLEPIEHPFARNCYLCLRNGPLIAESGERPAPELDDARRRYYKLTPLGRQVLDLESQRLKDLVRVLDARRRQEARS